MEKLEKENNLCAVTPWKRHFGFAKKVGGGWSRLTVLFSPEKRKGCVLTKYSTELRCKKGVEGKKRSNKNPRKFDGIFFRGKAAAAAV